MKFNCGILNEKNIGTEVSLNGWIRSRRDHGGKLFIDLADRYGETQLVFEEIQKEKIKDVGKESVIFISGKVKKREPDTINESIPTGCIEVLVSNFRLLNKSLLPPFELVDEKTKVLPNEELRLKYRYLDLRRKEMISNILFRDSVTKQFRKFFWDNGFLELETPTLVKDNYDTGSRTFLVPSRINKGKVYALAQSPQIYKQMCMISGLDKYFQIARCYRDEDGREDRQPEFTQIDFEVSFEDERYIQGIVEEAINSVFKKALHKELLVPFKHISYTDAMALYGSDKPDLRYDNYITDITEEAGTSNYNILTRIVKNKGKVKALRLSGAHFGDVGGIDEKFILYIVEIAKTMGLPGLTWLFFRDMQLNSNPKSIVNSLREIEQKLIAKLSPKEGDLILIGADLSDKLLTEVLGKLRKVVSDKIGTFKSEYEILWVDRFPLFEIDEVTGVLKPAHNPFTSPTEESIEKLWTNPVEVTARQFDLVLNGVEIGSGSIRIIEPVIQRKIFEIMGFNKTKIDSSFGFLLDGLAHGAPPHGGMGLGLDRFVALMAGVNNIRNFILFPKTKKFESPLDGSPGEVDEKRLKEDYGLAFVKPEDKK